jgi:hypothetical protein
MEKIDTKKKNNFYMMLGMVAGGIVVGCMTYLFMGNRNFSNNNSNKESNENKTVLTEVEAKDIAQNAYELAYDIVDEGIGITSTEMVEINHNGEKVECYEINFASLNNVFTEEGLNYIKSNYADSFSGNDKYYRCENTDNFMTKGEGFINTIFGVTDSNVRDLKITSFTDTEIKAIGQLEASIGVMGDEKPLNITFKKINNVWRIDTFE